MKIHIATSELVVIEPEIEEMMDENMAQTMVRSALEEKKIEQWSSIEVEIFTYNTDQLIFAKPIKIYIPSFLSRLTE